MVMQIKHLVLLLLNSFFSTTANCCGFEVSPVCIYFIAWPRSSLIIEFQQIRSEYYAVESLNVNQKLRLESKAILYHVHISGRYFFVCQLINMEF